MADSKPRGHSVNTPNIIAGAGLGMVFGLVSGLTATPVVASIISGLIVIVTAFLGLTESKLAGLTAATPWKIASFSFASAVALLFGIYIRTHELLAPSLSDQYIALLDAQFEPAQASALLQYRHFGVLLTKEGGIAGVREGGQDLNSVPALFSGSDDDCNKLLQDETSSVEQRTATMIEIGGEFEAVARRVAMLPPDRRVPILDAARFYLCAE